jgi:hypothetical protein
MKSIAESSDSVNSSQEDIVLKVLGGHRSGHVRGKGCGAIPPRSISSSAHTHYNHDECLVKQLETEQKLAAMEAEMKKSKETQAVMQAQLERLLNHLGG